MTSAVLGEIVTIQAIFSRTNTIIVISITLLVSVSGFYSSLVHSKRADATTNSKSRQIFQK